MSEEIEQATGRFKKRLESGFYRDRNGKSIVAKEDISEEITIEQARDTLRNAAWLGTDEDRERIERVVELLCGEPYNDCISRQAALDYCIRNRKSDTWDYLHNLPPVTPKHKVGKWIYHMETWPTSWYRCSICGGEEERTSNYCPNCGAKMEGPQESDEQMRDATKEEQESVDNYITSISTATIPLSVIEDIKAEIKSLYAYYGDGSGWEESRNITLNQVMSIIEKHISGKE